MEPAEFYLLTASYRNCSCGVDGDDIRYLAISVLGVFTSAGAWTFTACLDGLTDFDENLPVPARHPPKGYSRMPRTS